MQNSKQHFHFIGISGIGMSGLAKILLQQGHTVTGCDKNIDNKHVQELKQLKCNISSMHQSKICNQTSITTIVYTSAIKPDHPELLQAQKNNIPTLLRSDMLAQLMQKQTSLAIAGSHGKTSTTALVAHILQSALLDPTIVVGGHINSLNTNAHYGTGQYLVAEADESDRSLLKLPKKYAIVTNVDLEHLETYKDFDDVKQTFITFMNNLEHDGKNIICIDDHGIQTILQNIKTPYITYGQSNTANLQARNIRLEKDKSMFNIYKQSSNSILGTITLPQAGIHYVLNATGAVALCLELNVPFNNIQDALSSFSGVDRRFTFKGISTSHRAEIYDDYGHHPKEMAHALTIARQNTKNKLVVVFQPHRYSRTKHLWNDFIELFTNYPIDILIIADIYAASENEIEGVSSAKLVEDIKQKKPNLTIQHCSVDPKLKVLHKLLEQHLEENDLLLLLGAGKINKIAGDLLA